ncbi:hypothetical protein GCM10010293_00630 [Streptomyces griseoflavus]|nr:hypothetical protein GCM10010293_00630 [Streptomyces griseoflavus]
MGVGGRDVGVGEDGVRGEAAEQPVDERAGRHRVFIASRFDTAHDHSVAPGAIGVNPVYGTRVTTGCDHRT